MKRKTIQLVILAILVALVAYLSLRDNSSTISKKSTNFQFDDIENTDSIIITSGNYETSIVAIGKNWEVNGSRISTKRFVLFLETLKNLHSIAPITGAELNQVSSLFRKQGIHVQAFSGKKIIYSAEFVSTPELTVGNKTNKEVYTRVAIKGFEGVPLHKLISARPEFWQADILFNFENTDLTDVSIVYVKEPEHSFRLAFDLTRNFRLINYKGKTINTKIDTGKVLDYTNFFTGIQFEEIDTIMFKMPSSPDGLLFTFRVGNSNNKLIQLDAYPMISIQTGEPDLNKFCAVLERKKLIVLNYNQFDPILADLHYFLKK